MASDWIRYFNEINKKDVMIVGGKGANLGEMTGAGFPVPEGFVITAEAYRTFMAANGISEKTPSVREKILEGILPQELKEEILTAFRNMQAGKDAGDGKDTGSGNNPESGKLRVAVRSSATAEDLPDASFAGQQETYLNVMGEEDLLKRVLECYASL